MEYIVDEEFFWLTLTIVFTGILWLPYIFKLICEDGPIAAFTAKQGTRTPDAPWAERLKKAHYNAVENLVLFAPLVVMVVFSNLGSELSVQATMVYFFARVAHAVIYTLGIPFLRSLVFGVGVACQAVLALILLGVL